MQHRSSISRAWVRRPKPVSTSMSSSTVPGRKRDRTVVEQSLVESLRAPQTLDTPGKRLAATFYASGIDEAAVNRRGLESVQSLLREINALQERSQLPAILAKLARVGIDPPLRVYLQPDPKGRRRYLLTIDQGGLGLPDRDDYFRSDARGAALREGYEVYTGRLETLAGLANAASDVQASFGLEKEFAAASLTRVERRD